MLSDVNNENNKQFNTAGGIDTKDKVFLLSIKEAAILFDNDKGRVEQNTVYSIAQGTRVKSNSGAGSWWLRSPGSSQDWAAVVNSDGTTNRSGNIVDVDRNAVRPALWLDLSSW